MLSNACMLPCSTQKQYRTYSPGYHDSKNKLPGYEMGITDSWYFVPLDKKDRMRIYWPPGLDPVYSREFPTAWRDIDNGIDELHEVSSAVV